MTKELACPKLQPPVSTRLHRVTIGLPPGRLRATTVHTALHNVPVGRPTGGLAALAHWSVPARAVNRSHGVPWGRGELAKTNQMPRFGPGLALAEQ